MLRTSLSPIRLLLALVGAVVLAAGCGGGSAESGRDREREVAGVVRGYLDAYIHGRGEEACGFYAPAFRAEGEERARAGGVEGGCAEALSSVGRTAVERLPQEARAGFVAGVSRPKRIDVVFAGERALATVTFGVSRGPEDKRIELVDGQDGFGISRLAVSRGEAWP